MKKITYLLLMLFSLSYSFKLLGQSTFNELSASQILKTSVSQWPKDFVGVAKEPFKCTKKTLLYSGITLGLIATDVPTQRFIQNTVNPAFEWSPKRILNSIYNIRIGGKGLFGASTNTYLITGIAAQYAVSRLIKLNKKHQIAPILATKAVINSFVISHLVLKSVFGRKRPAEPIDDTAGSSLRMRNISLTRSPWDFGNWEFPMLGKDRSGSAFPSFHFSLYFSVARIYYRVFDNAWWAYALPIVGLMPAFDKHNHWFSDMFLGAVIGTVIGDVIYRNFRSAALRDDLSSHTRPNFIKKLIRKSTIIPVFSNQSTGMSLIISL